MTRKQFRTRVKYLQRKANKALTQRYEELLNSGAIDLKRENSGILPKVVLYSALNDIARRFRPLSKECADEAKNLQHF